MKIFFWIGYLMIAYDWLGHVACSLARISATTSRPLMALWWNKYSTKIWPSISNSLSYDVFWSAWFGTALIFILWGYTFRRL